MAISEPGTGTEHMGASYLWRANKRGHRVHIQNPETGRTFCQVENCGGKPFDGKGPGIPDGRRLCQNCADLVGRNEADYREPSLAVLMGERLAETEPGLFLSTAAARPAARTDLTSSHGGKKWKRKKQVRPVNRSQGHKPKRSKVKYLRPFDDPLPW